MSEISPAPRSRRAWKRAGLTFGCFWLCAASPGVKNAQEEDVAAEEQAADGQEEGQSVPFGAATRFGFRTRVRALTPREQREYQDLQLQFSKTTADAQKAIQKRLDEIAESVAVLAKPKGKGGDAKEAADSPLASLRGDVAALKTSSEKQTAALSEIVLLLKQQAAFNRLLFGYASEAPAAGGASAPPSTGGEPRGAGALQDAAERAQERLQEKAADAVSVRKVKTPPPAAAPVSPAAPPPVRYEEPETLKAPDGGGAWIIR